MLTVVKNTLVIGFFVFLLTAFSAGTVFAKENSNPNLNTPNNGQLGTGTSDEGDNLHPSGKDRSVENGNSYPQGNAQSDPDDNGKGPDRTNGGIDQLGGTGGVDLQDQDANNGCGNDDDFEDDNEGWCGHKPKDQDNGDETGDDDHGCHDGQGDENHDSDGGENHDGNGGSDENNDGGENPAPNPVDNNPVVPENGQVLGITTLPNTASSAENSGGLPLGFILILSGVALHLYAKKAEVKIEK